MLHILVLWFNIVGKKFGQVFGVIIVIFLDVFQKEDQPVNKNKTHSANHSLTPRQSILPVLIQFRWRAIACRVDNQAKEAFTANLIWLLHYRNGS